MSKPPDPTRPLDGTTLQLHRDRAPCDFAVDTTEPNPAGRECALSAALRERDALRVAVQGLLSVGCDLSRCRYCHRLATGRTAHGSPVCPKHEDGGGYDLPQADAVRALLALLPPEAP